MEKNPKGVVVLVQSVTGADRVRDVPVKSNFLPEVPSAVVRNKDVSNKWGGVYIAFICEKGFWGLSLNQTIKMI
jgi:hypothetical protein